MQLKASSLCLTNMASRKRRAKKKTETPAERHLRFQITTSANPGTETSHFVDIAKNLSGLNRRLYRQGKHYFIKKITVTSRNTDSGFISFSTAPYTWMVSNAWRTGFEMWNKMRLEHGGAPGSGLPASVTPATWSDFKVYLSADHKTAGSIQALDNGNNGVAVNEWRYSLFSSPDSTGGAAADQYDVKLLGNHDGGIGNYSCVGLIDAYAESRRTVQIDDTGDEMVGNSPWIQLFDDGETLDEVLSEMKIDGDEPPYDLDIYTGLTGNMPKPLVREFKSLVNYQAGGANAPSVSFGGFSAPCGLLEIEVSSLTPSDTVDVLIELAPGDYKGVKALPM